MPETNSHQLQMRRGEILQEFLIAEMMDDTATQAALKAEYQSLAALDPVVQSPSEAQQERMAAKT